MSKPILVVVGYGMVGHHFLEQAVSKQLHSHYQIIVYGDEPYFAYDRVHLSEYFSGKTAADLALGAPDFLEKSGIIFRSSGKVTAIERMNHWIEDSDGHKQPYDTLVLATGSYPFVPPIQGNDNANCFVYRTLTDLDSISLKASNASRGVVIGGGLLGLEAANALKQLGLNTHVVEFAPRLMAVQLDDDGGKMLRQKIEALEVKVHLSKQTKEIRQEQDGSLTLLFADGETLNTDLVVFSAGIRPQDTLAIQAGILTGARGGIEINDQCETSEPGIYAIGECAVWQGRHFGLVAPGYQMARVLAATLSGEALAFTGADMSTKLKLLGVDVASFGDAQAAAPDCQSYVWTNGPKEIYKKIVVSGDGKKLLGGVLVGDCEDYSSLLQMMLNEMDLPEHPEQLILPQQGASPRKKLGAASLPDTAQVCSCQNVSKGDIFKAIDAGCGDMGSVKACTKAATGCGGCSALVKQLMDFRLSEQGVQVKKDICEHFALSRQELYHIVRVEKLKDFESLLHRHGRGKGCEICKPAVASILASCWNEYLIKPEHLPLQDTNDRFFANVQNNGTYSVVPRIPAGEITPKGLITIGEIAEKYNLYTKITGGQRIDMFGANLDDLPDIWQALIEAGFETGHAYGKSLRTVKSCVGSTWCRYGVQDSTRFAIMLENRYKGLRSPHKIKMAVSGCTRECAEAQSKDIGVIATEKGWNLYVCGNGGMKPRHAELFASDLDDTTLIRYVDRILMFYIRTADRLQRTSVWMDNMEGGIDYLRSVIIEDSLSINQELENEMNLVVGRYQCEWRTTIDSSDRRALFRSTINSAVPDETVVWETERAQIRPSRHNVLPVMELPKEAWTEICQLKDIPEQAGVGARLGNHRIALFRLGDDVFAVDDSEPGSEASVISRGIVGDTSGDVIIITPLYKQRYRLKDGKNVDNNEQSIRVWPVRIENNAVLVGNASVPT